MAIFDISIIGILAISIFLGFYRGFIKSTLGLIFMCAALLLGYISYIYLYKIANPHISNKQYLEYFTITSAAICTFFFSFIVGGKLISIIGIAIGGGAIDRIFGVIFGVIRGGILAIAFYIIALSASLNMAFNDISPAILYEAMSDDTKTALWLRSGQIYSPIAESSKFIISYFKDSNIDLREHTQQTEQDIFDIMN